MDLLRDLTEWACWEDHLGVVWNTAFVPEACPHGTLDKKLDRKPPFINKARRVGALVFT